MRLTHESPRARRTIMALVWVFAAALLALHVRVARDFQHLVDRQGLRGATSPSTPLQHTVPLIYADAQMWVLHALDLQGKGDPRVRFTRHDNAPFGREVHWSSSLTWALAGAGFLRHQLTGETFPLATERCLPWINAALLLALVVGFSAWTTRRAGAAAGLIVAFGMIGHRDFYEGFSPYYVDHHGLITASIFGLVLGAIFMSGGWWRHATGDSSATLLPTSPASARQAAVVSAVSGAVGLWLSAASVIPAIALTAFAALAALFLWGTGARSEGAAFDAAVWRLWGRVGAAASLALYFVEYAPAAFSLRLEVNHPLYALAWWGGAEVFALFAEIRLAPAGAPRTAVRRWLPPLGAIALAPLVIIVGGPAVFNVSDPFIGRLSSHVLEGMSLPTLVQRLGWEIFFLHVNETLLPALPVLVGLLVGRSRDRVALGFAALVTLGFVAQACWSVRFWQNSAGPQLGLTLVALAVLTQTWTTRTRWLLILATAGGLFLPASVSRVLAIRNKIVGQTAARTDLIPARHRDIAAALRASQPTGDIVLLACPSTSQGVGYYGRFQTVGTLFWENAVGLRAAAEMFSATDEADARRRLAERRVTHIVLTSEEDFLGEYFSLLRPAAPSAEIAATFGHQLSVRQQIPTWLRVLPYAPPPDLRWPGLRVLLLQIVPDQPAPVALYHIAAAQLANDQPDRAEATLHTALQATVASEQAAFAVAAGNLCYQRGARPAAARLYRAGFSQGGNLTLAANLAWQLATDRDDTVRDGSAALDLARRAVALSSDDVSAVNALAAALAETGNFVDAATTASRALELVHATGDASATASFEQRLAAYRAGRPWRQ